METNPDTVPSPQAEQHGIKNKGTAYWAQRITIGVGGAFACLALIYSGPPLALALFLTCLATWGVHEFYRAVRRQGSEPTDILGIIACILFQASALYSSKPIFSHYLPALLAILMIAALFVELVKAGGHPIPNLGTTLLGAIYVGWLMSFFIHLRLMDHHTVIMKSSIPDYHVGPWLVILVCTVTWLGDTAALVTGYFVGRTKLAPKISPAKTWEGAIGGALFGTFVGTGLGLWLGFDLVPALTLSILMTVFGQVGDLCESAIKRNLGLKDFGTAFANHGGVLDRIDSLLFAAPVAFYFIQVFLAPR
ncbi:MAG: phosphatidate cytidylyltransferase [Capsulimonadaceae bacterium]|nr:phosphatidate cytidylyltransferase [Capsulimonadaceae bacterium]